MIKPTQRVILVPLFFLALLFAPVVSRGDSSENFTAIQTGLWNAPATWGKQGTAQPGVTIPGPNSDVTIQGGITVQTDASAVAVRRLTVQAHAGLTNAPGARTIRVTASDSIENLGTMRGQDADILLQVDAGALQNQGAIIATAGSDRAPGVHLVAESGLILNEGLIAGSSAAGSLPGGFVWLQSKNGQVMNRGLIYGGDSRGTRGGPVLISGTTVLLRYGRISGGRQNGGVGRGKVAVVATKRIVAGNSHVTGQQISLAVGGNGRLDLEDMPEGAFTAGSGGLWISGGALTVLDLQGNSHRFAPLHSLGGSVNIQADADRRYLDPGSSIADLSAPAANLSSGGAVVRPMVWFTAMPPLLPGQATVWQGQIVNVGNTTGALQLQLQAPAGWQSGFANGNIIPLLARQVADFQLTITPPATTDLHKPISLTMKAIWLANPQIGDEVAIATSVNGQQCYFPRILQNLSGKSVAAFSLPANIRPGQPIALSNMSSGRPPLHFLWDFADCHGDSAAAAPQPVCDGAGWRQFSLQVSGPGGSDSLTRWVHVDGPPQPQLSWAGAEKGPAVWGEAHLLGWDRSNERDITQAIFQYWQGDHWALIGDGISAGEQIAPGAWQLTWPTTALPPGTYTVRLWLLDASGQQATMDANLTVQKPPVPKASVVQWNGKQVTFSAADSLDRDNQISSYHWDFGDGGQGTGMTVTHSYAGVGPYTMRLLLQDETNLSGEESYTWDPSTHTLSKVTTCGCQSIVLRSQGQSDLPLPWLSSGERFTLGALTDTSTPLTARSQWEVVATLKPGSNANACWSHEKARGSIRWSDYSGTQNLSYQLAGLPYPNSSQFFGFHGQRMPGYQQARQGRTVRWSGFAGWGAPVAGLGLDAITRTAGATLIATYRAQVAGDDGSCGCTWQVRLQVDKDGNISGQPRIEHVQCTP